jgi:serine/threonine-protein kinase HipA
VGRIWADDADRIAFAYSRDWLDDPRAMPISWSMPLREQPMVGGAAHAFFANLLPEGVVREAVAARLGISRDNDIALLRAIGGECAGALSIVDLDRSPPDPEEPRYEELQASRLRELTALDRVVPLLIGGTSTRLSLAGAQHKLPVAVLDGKLHLPLHGSPSTHILKLPHSELSHVPANEAFTSDLALRIGLDVVRVELLHATDPPSLLVERYDRRRSDDPWPVVRVHQEDICQALGLLPTRKYEQEGGPSFASIIELVRAGVRAPLIDVRRLLEWQAFAIVAGNSDGHAKNLSLLHEAGGSSLAPFYDLVSTRYYERLDRDLAAGVGGRRNPDEIGRAEWAALAEELGIGARLVKDLARGVAERCAGAVSACARDFRERYGDHPILQRLPRAIEARARRALRAI